MITPLCFNVFRVIAVIIIHSERYTAAAAAADGVNAASGRAEENVYIIPLLYVYLHRKNDPIPRTANGQRVCNDVVSK